MLDEELEKLKELVLDKNGLDVYLQAKDVTPIDLVRLCSCLGMDYSFSILSDILDGDPIYTLVPALKKALAEREKNV